MSGQVIRSAQTPRQGAAVVLAQAMVGTCFLLSFLQYCVRRGDWVRVAPMLVLMGGTLMFLLLASRDERRHILCDIFRPGFLVVPLLATLPPLLSSLYRGSWYPFEYGLVLVATLLAARVLLCGIGLSGLMRAFFYAMSLSMTLTVGLTLPQLAASFGASRYFPFYLEPNRIAFFAVTAIPVQLWMAVHGRRRYYALGLAALCGVVTLAASSRGSTGALLMGAGVVLSLAFFRHRDFTGIRRRSLAAALMALLLAAGLALAEPAFLPESGDYLWTKLDLGTRSRGLDSGFTGRTNGWSTLLEVLPKTSWLVGNGYRSSDEDFDFPVDSGYLSSAYELGLFSTAVVLLKSASVLVGLGAAYLTRAGGAGVLFLIFTLAVFFVNGSVHRVLFGYGDPASLFALFCFVSSRRDAVAASMA
jgi:hypothetical protein